MFFWFTPRSYRRPPPAAQRGGYDPDHGLFRVPGVKALPRKKPLHLRNGGTDVPLTGRCRLTAYTAAHDVGKAINPELCRGQVGSALQQGMGLVFCEQVKIDPKTGQPLNATLQRYHVARAYDFPHIETVLVEYGSPEGPYGAKSIGESCFVPVAPALLAAVNDALQTDLTTLPLTPEKIIRAVQEKRKEASL